MEWSVRSVSASERSESARNVSARGMSVSARTVREWSGVRGV